MSSEHIRVYRAIVSIKCRSLVSASPRLTAQRRSMFHMVKMVIINVVNIAMPAGSLIAPIAPLQEGQVHSGGSVSGTYASVKIHPPLLHWSFRLARIKGGLT